MFTNGGETLFERSVSTAGSLQLRRYACCAMDDGMVTDLAATGTRLEEVADTAADDDVARTLGDLLEAVGEAGAEPADPVGPVGVAKALRDPDTQAGIGFLLALAKALGRATG
ncbi:hypothetical protein C488_00527 [Natrinema pellirubrum DSM 15624]|uniref:DUF1641 domain-containing protein n=1 Tax=Natrinema pellirubrum (strain DSM 15624 / CIP 106293 / JCM 10476 / NCIMB 786 / 157) TaxID=797303 RepID=L9Z8W2_NATP1|nr:hypothetical protein C488_00527 [Natrinema pellirubrum DSM 15624]